MADWQAGNGRALSRRQWVLRIVGVVLVSLGLLLAFYGAVAYVAWQRGQTLRTERAQTQIQEEMVRQMSLARTDIEEGNYLLAQRRLEWVMQRNPNYPGAQTLYDQALAQGQQRLTPEAPQATPTPRPTPMPTPTAVDPGVLVDPGQELARARQLAADEEWERAIAAIIAFQTQFPGYERLQTDRLLYEANIAYGLQLLQTPQVERGLFYLGQAARLGELPPDAAAQRLWAELYLLGVSFYGVDWNATIFYFDNLCRAAPFFQNSCQRLHESLVAHGDLYADMGDWCPAVERYRQAQQQQSSAVVSQKLDQAFVNCQNATPTPDPDMPGNGDDGNGGGDNGDGGGDDGDGGGDNGDGGGDDDGGGGGDDGGGNEGDGD